MDFVAPLYWPSCVLHVTCLNKHSSCHVCLLLLEDARLHAHLHVNGKCISSCGRKWLAPCLCCYLLIKCFLSCSHRAPPLASLPLVFMSNLRQLMYYFILFFLTTWGQWKRGSRCWHIETFWVDMALLFPNLGDSSIRPPSEYESSSGKISSAK